MVPSEDPDELRNVWGDETAGTMRARMLEKLAYLMLEHVDTSPYPSALA